MPPPHGYPNGRCRPSLAGAVARPWAERFFVSDIFNEVDEEVRREQLKKLWERYSNLIIGVAILLVAAVGAWRGYEFWQARKAAEAGAAYEAALKLSDEGKHSEAEEAFGKLAAQGTSGYRVLARMRQAAELGATDPKAGIAAYDAIAGEPGAPLVRELAAIRAAFLLVDTAKLDEMAQRLEPLTSRQQLPPHRAGIAGSLGLAQRRCRGGAQMGRGRRQRSRSAARRALAGRSAELPARRCEQAIGAADAPSRTPGLCHGSRRRRCAGFRLRIAGKPGVVVGHQDQALRRPQARSRSRPHWRRSPPEMMKGYGNRWRAPAAGCRGTAERQRPSRKRPKPTPKPGRSQAASPLRRSRHRRRHARPTATAPWPSPAAAQPSRSNAAQAHGRRRGFAVVVRRTEFLSVC